MTSLGRIINHDPESFNYRTTHTATTLVKVDWDDNAPITDQGQVGACVGFTCLDLMNNHVFAGNRLHATGSADLLPNAKGLDFYHEATVKDGFPGNTYPPHDGGSSGLGGAKGLQVEHYITSYTHAFTLTEFLAALQHQPVMVGTEWTQGMFKPDAHGVIKPTGSVAGGHEYGAFGYDPKTQLIKFRNHWSASWGSAGRFYMHLADFAKLLANQGDVTIPAPIPA